MPKEASKYRIKKTRLVRESKPLSPDLHFNSVRNNIDQH